MALKLNLLFGDGGPLMAVLVQVCDESDNGGICVAYDGNCRQVRVHEFDMLMC